MEQDVINRTKKLNTKDTLIQEFSQLGVKKGMVLLVHSSLSSLGWVCGGAQAVIEALQAILTEEGTLVMPAHSGHLSDPKDWCNPPVPAEWWYTIREMMPAFVSDLTPTWAIGSIPEVFRHYPGVVRSNHPQTSFCAWGKYAKQVTENHSLSFSLGENSPLQALYHLDADVLFIGTAFDTHTSFHLAEYAQHDLPVQEVGAPILENGVRVWKQFLELEYDTENFEKLGKGFEAKYHILKGKVGQARCRLFKQRISVDFAREYYLNKK